MTDPIPSSLARLSQATRMLAEARTFDDVRAIRDMAEAARAYAVAAGLGDEAIGYASAIKLDAERKAGELLVKMRETGERAAGRPEKESPPATLSGLGVTKTQSSRWQALARLPEEEYAEVRQRVETRARGAEALPVSGVMRDQEDAVFDRVLTDEDRRRARAREFIADLRLLSARVREVAPTPEERDEIVGLAQFILGHVTGTGSRLEVVR